MIETPLFVFNSGMDTYIMHEEGCHKYPRPYASCTGTHTTHQAELFEVESLLGGRELASLLWGGCAGGEKRRLFLRQ